MDYRWFSVVGLASDIFGFALLAWDLWPEYRVHILGIEADHIHKRVESSATETPPVEPAGQVIGELLTFMSVVDLEKMRRRLRLSPRKFAIQGEGIDLEEVAISRVEVEHAIAGRYSELATRFRPPVGLGITLVFLGFALQMIGSWPR